MQLQTLLREFRRRNDLAQKETAQKLGISREHYARIESGHAMPSLKLMQMIARELILTVEVRVHRDGFEYTYRKERRLKKKLGR